MILDFYKSCDFFQGKSLEMLMFLRLKLCDTFITWSFWGLKSDWKWINHVGDENKKICG